MAVISDIRYSARSLWASRGRTLLTALGVIIGVMSVVAVGSVGASAQDLVVSQVSTFGANLVAILPGRSADNEPPPMALGIISTSLDYKDYQAVRKLPHVEAGSPFVQTAAAITYSEKSIATAVKGAGAEMLELEDTAVVAGRFFSERDVASYGRVAVLGHTVAERLFPGIDPLGKQIRIKGYGFQVIGVIEERGFAFFQDQDDQVVVPVTAAQKVLLGIDHINFMRFKIDKASNIPDFERQAEWTLRSRHGIRDTDKDDFSVRSANQAIDILGNVTGVINSFLILVTAISLLVGGINIMNIMYVSVRERTREIGLRKALGAKPAAIARQFLTESALISVTGGLFGVALGGLLTVAAYFVINQLGLDWALSFPLSYVLIALGVAAGIGLGFGYAPARQAANLDAIESLRYE
jgi:putative ABC transport system permease protein